MSRYALFSGCTIRVMLPHLEAASRKVMSRLGVELVDLPFTCCPTTAIREVDDDAWLTMAARNLATAEREGLDILALCNGCTQSLKEAQAALKDDARRAAVNAKLADIGLEYRGTAAVRHFAEVLYDMREDLATLADGRLTGVRVASQPGCHLLRPSAIMAFDDAERPVKYEELIEAIGATPVDYPNKTLCCGFTLFDVDRAASATIVMDKVEGMSQAGADLVTTGCPSCFTQFDRNQLVAQRLDGRDLRLPVVFFPQLVGLALGFSADEMGLGQHRVKVEVSAFADAPAAGR
jgi:heterodisulfide reductase subunit B